MDRHSRTLQQLDQPRIAPTEVIDPDLRIDQDQAGFPERLRGAVFSADCVPPNRARRLALSRSISALSASLSMAVRSIGPVN
jgi:hypothetical protein